MMTTMTFTLTEEQAAAIEELRMTTIAGNPQLDPKTPEQMIWQVLEYGTRALQQQRKQYMRQRAAVKAYAGR